MADDPANAVADPLEGTIADGAETTETPETSEEPRYTADDIRAMPLADLIALIPAISEHIDAEAEEVHRRELERVLPVHREQWYQEQEDTWLDYIERTRPGDYIAAKNQVKRARDTRGMDTTAREAGVQRLIDESVRRYAQPFATRLLNLSVDGAADVAELAARAWPPGLDGVQQYIEAVQDRIVLRSAEKRLKEQERLIAQTERKAGRAEADEESPDLGSAQAGGPTRRDRGWFDRLTLPERQKFRREHTVEYNALMAG